MEPNGTVPPVVPPQEPITQPIPPAFQPQRKSKKLVFIGITILVLIIILAVVGYVFIYKRDNLQVITPSPTPTTVLVSPTSSTTTNTLNETVILKKGVETPVPNTDISLTFVKSSEIPENCADCIATTAINIKKGANLKELDYSCGGIAGKCETKISHFGYTIELLQEIDNETAKVLVTNK